MDVEFELTEYHGHEKSVSSIAAQIPVEFEGSVQILTRQARVNYEIEGIE